MKLETIKIDEWMPLDNEAYREYVFPNGGVYRVDRPQRVLIKRKPEGDSHRIISLGSNDQPVSHYVPAGWIAIRWEGVDGTEAFNW